MHLVHGDNKPRGTGVRAGTVIPLVWPISQAINHANPERELTDSAEVFESSGADLHPVLISSAGSIGTGPSLQPPVDSSVQSMELYIQANAEPEIPDSLGLIGLSLESSAMVLWKSRMAHSLLDSRESTTISIRTPKVGVSSSSSYAYQNTVHSCGMNNSQGGSYNTQVHL